MRCGLAAATVCPWEGERTNKIDSIPNKKEEEPCKSTNWVETGKKTVDTQKRRNQKREC